MADKYASLRKKNIDLFSAEVDQLNTLADDEIRGLESAFASGEAAVTSPYVQSLIGDVNADRREGIRVLQESLADELDDIQRLKIQSYIDNVLDIAKIGVAVVGGVGVVTGAISAAEVATKEARKTDSTAPAVEPVIPYAKVVKESLPALNSASNILNRTNYRYTQLKRGDNR